jgi:adiponectin receptor
MPDWYQDNYYIIGGYRPISGSYAGSFASWGYLHNEFVNIYTHSLGAVFYPLLGCGLYFALKDRYAASSVGDALACGCFFLSALLCLGMSTAFHTIMNHSPKIRKFGALDYLGIVCLITGSFVPNVYYGYYCDLYLQVAYWSMVSNVIPAPYIFGLD